MDTIHDILLRHPAFDPKTGTDIPAIEEIYAANVMTYEQALAEQARSKREQEEFMRKSKSETEGERIEREADQLRLRLRRSGAPERFLDAPIDKTCDLSNGKGAFVFGMQGTGKTTKAVGMLKGWLADNAGAAWFTTSANLLTEIGATYSSYESEQSVIYKYGKCKMLVIDDLGKENPTDQALMKLWQVIDMRYGAMLSTIVTTQYNFGELCAQLGHRGGLETAKAIVSRLYETCKPVSMGDVDHRRKK